ncbi:GumC family protein [Maribellus maritimus]|uniref:GumC family protein n=1 Tax=Maribellus maritimus TaxID=2870838 RepID=UPI001EEA5870|nr:polysaccharide biosynthesis tyrosine autokinase [Maribellus maritimus]MCG6190252.1 polysaccharide biosynthesis tyrosine autokinase [Maribellus maritimus]
MEKIDEIISLIDAYEKKQTKNYFLKYLKKWPWFLALCVIGVGLGFFKYKNSPNVYQVGSRILIKGQESSIGNVFTMDNPLMSMGKKSNIENQIGILQSYTLYQKALQNLDWQTSWYKKELLYNKELYNSAPFDLVIPPNARNAEQVMIEIEPLNDKQFSIKIEGETALNGYWQAIEIEQTMNFGEPFSNEFFNFTVNSGNGRPEEVYYLKFNNLNSLTKQYLGKTEIGLEDINSDLISISITGVTPRKEADFINELNNVFVQFGVQNKVKNSDNSMEFIDSQLDRIQKSLKTAEDNFSDYRKNNQVMNLTQEAQLVYAKLEEIENEQYMTEMQYDYYNDLQQYLDDSKKIEEMVNPSVIGITDANLTNMLKKLMDLYSRREVLSMSVQEKNPSLIMLEKEIQIARDGLNETLKNQLKTTETKLESIKERYASVQDRLKKLPETEKKMIGIQREFDLNNDLYTYMLQKKAEASISKASIAPEVQVIDPARIEAATMVGPSMVKNVGLGFFGGFFITFAVITLIGFFNNKIETREEIEKGTKLPVLEGIIQHKYKVKLPVIHHPRSGIAESFRGIKSNLNAILEQPGAKVVSINSLVPGEGKSFISSNFSAILTKTNKKVLLIGADLHKPTLHNYLDMKEAPGLSDYLQNEKSIEEIILPTNVPNLSFIQAGPVPANPSDLIDGDKLGKLVDRARKIYDYIIIDNAPLLLVPDAIITSRFSDVSLFILRINHSHKDQIGQINKIVDFNKVEKAAVVINETPDRGYGYGNKYWKKGYGEYKGKMSIA